MTRVSDAALAGVEGRRRVQDLARTDLHRAVEEARKIRHPWYRCQSLAYVAAAVQSDQNAVSLLREAFAAAREQSEPNRIVSVAAWPLSILMQRGGTGAEALVHQFLEIIGPEPNPIRRADALILLLEAAFPNAALRHRILEPLLQALLSCKGWKSRRLLQFTALIMAAESREAAERICALMPPSKEARRARTMIERREWSGPHSFVPHYQKD